MIANQSNQRRADWEADAIRDDIGRLDAVARLLTGRALRDPADHELAAALMAIDRVQHDLELVVQEIDGPATMVTRCAFVYAA